MAHITGMAANVDAAMAAIERKVQRKLVQFGQAVGIQTIAYLRSLTSEVRPPKGARTTNPFSRRTVSPGRLANGPIQRRLGARTSMGRGPARLAHPGHWADDTSILAASYSSSVKTVGPGSVLLTLKNSASYAKWLEDRNGYWVLSGALVRGGPVDQAIAALNQQFGFNVSRSG